MGNQMISCKQCTTLNSTISIINQQPKFNTIDYSFKQNFGVFGQQSRTIPQQILSYNKNYQELIAALRCNNLRFEDSYFPINNGSLGYTLIQDIKDYKWKRIHQLFIQKKMFDKCYQNQQSYLSLSSTTTSFKSKNYVYTPRTNIENINSTIHQALLQILKHPQLIQRAIPNPIIIRQGIFIVYLCLNGQSRNPVEVIIDDYIPVDKNNKYLFAKKGHTIWMLILQKAFAKILGNYGRLKNIQTSQYLEEIVGIPVYNLNWYNPSYHIQSSSLSLKGQKSIYYKFSLNNKSKVHLSIWQPRKSLFNSDVSYIDLAAELAIQTKTGYTRVAYSSQLQGNKLIIGQEPYQPQIILQPGKYFLHIYGRFPKIINRRVNIVAYSQQKMTLRQRQQNVMFDHKKSMLQKVFKDTLSSKKLTLVKQQKDLGIRFFWDGHRGILCIKNQNDQSKQLRIIISKDKRLDVFFEDDSQQIQKMIQVGSGKNALIYFIRRKDQDIGYFYEIKTL